MKGPRVGELVRHIQKSQHAPSLLRATPLELRQLAATISDETDSTRMLALLLAEMTPGQRTLLAAKARIKNHPLS